MDESILMKVDTMCMKKDYNSREIISSAGQGNPFSIDSQF